MLKALELTGFKSFADRTRFDFPDGITVVVGPNGSGKSNVVDAVKWVLGAQSAKSLRGTDMADVIFKGSAEGGRKPANSAEVVLILDNSQRTFHFDADEVHVSRRVLRSGESEFAINNSPCRLKDIKDLFRGTGVGVDAYSLIEQGKVDRLLQASAKDRRGIFEEAAGISRFKAKKTEAERRLTRVDQNMLRLKDIVDEVGSRLATLKSQAARANRYRELTNLLQIKRQQLGWLDRNTIFEEQQKLIRQIEISRADEEKLKLNLTQLESVAAQEQQDAERLQRESESLQKELLEEQRVLITAEGSFASAKEREAELLLEQNLLKERIATLEQRVSLTAEEIAQKVHEIQKMDLEHGNEVSLLPGIESDLENTQSLLSELRSDLEACNKLVIRIREESVTTRSQITAYQLHVEQLTVAIAQQQKQHLDILNELQEFESNVSSCEERLRAAQQASQEANRTKSDAEAEVQRGRLALLNAQEQLIGLQGKLQGLKERLIVLEQLETQFTGGERGGQHLLRLARDHRSQTKPSDVSTGINATAWDSVIGLVADLLTTEMHLAPLIDVALGSHADAIVLCDGQMIDWINHGNVSVDGRVTLIRLDRLATRRTGEKIQLDGLRGVLGRADRMTRYNPDFEPLIRSLLGTTWFVDTLSTALELSHFRGAGLRFVTAECQLVESDGSITLGSLQSGLGLVSRRSEMQSAREQIVDLENQISQHALIVSTRQSEIVEAESWLRAKENEAHEAAKELTGCELRFENELQRKEKLVAALGAHQNGIDASERRLEEIRLSISHSEINLVKLTCDQNAEEQHQLSLTELVKNNELRVHELQSVVSDRRVQLARTEQRLHGLRVTLEQMQQDSAEREHSAEQSRQAMHSLESKLHSNIQLIGVSQKKAEESRTKISSIESVRSEFNDRVFAQSAKLQEAIRSSESARRALERGIDKTHALDKQIEQLKSQWDTLHLHYAQEFQINLEQLAVQVEVFRTHRERPDSHSATLDSPDDALVWISEMFDANEQDVEIRIERGSVESEIHMLRQEIASAGNVNMEALKELDDLQSRFDRLSNHYRDLDEARNGLISTMNKIDEDSRDMFLETLHSIRRNFQDLYRRSFGGGFADIVLENEGDPESGIEIVATPPGKTTLSNTLLSGGEKALTAVALIMAFFQYRPSPFCILDEVDAPFDEANIGRFVTVLREFLDSTKFIVVTHSKKTMTAANMIYGITMQESGVSRQVSVRFEEVDPRGEIIQSKRAA